MLRPETETLDLSSTLSHFAEHGYARLGRVLSDEGADELGERAHALMHSERPFPGLFYQHDSATGRYEDLVFNAGWVGPSPRYRKLERLELDPLFLSFIRNPLFEQLTGSLLGPQVVLYRSVLWNKAPGVGMAVPWHQDDGKFWGLNRPPRVQVWTALDDASEEAGCLEVVPGSHKHGLASAEGGTVSEEQLRLANADTTATRLPARRGESILVHNHLWHRTGRNHTAAPRRALSISFLDGETGCTRRRRAPRQFMPVFGPSPSDAGGPS
ncbi:MAG: phytanoyl-CoA hydroxylase [Myxococcota bacterium]|jgi:phytanoyl-CoA hydroxylase